MEIWKPLYQLYEISNYGRIKRKSDGHLLKTQKPDFLGYCHVCIKKEGEYVSKTVHRLVAEAFIENPLCKTDVHHINGIKTDNRAENLEWVTKSEHAEKDKVRRNGKPTKYRENFLARKNMSF